MHASLTLAEIRRSAWGEMLEKELQYPEYDLTSDYMEMLVQVID